MVTFSRGDVVLCDLNLVVGSEQRGIRFLKKRLKIDV